LKDIGPMDFIDAIRRVVDGETVYDRRISLSGCDASLGRTTISLTPREYDVLRRAAMGESNPEIADAMELSRHTVKAYLQSVMQKLGARNRVEAISRANELGLL
jgi:two-component system, NarL family, nitrate/nitrite response regulator NarL